MPRAGGVYSAPPGTTATPNTPVASAPYNAFVADLVADANAARPVTAGGTGSGTAIGGFDNLSVAGASIASASTVNLANATGSSLTITGTVTITSFGTVPAGAERVLTFAAALTLTYNATSMILPGAANIATAAGDVATFRSLGSGNWQCVSYQRANGQPVGSLTQPTLILKQSAAPAPTAEGDIQWDTDDNILLIGDGAAAQTFVPFPASVVAGDLFYATSAKALTRLAKGTAGQALIMNAGATAPSWVTLAQNGTLAAASGTSVAFTGIPAGAREVTIMARGISFTAAGSLKLRVGPAAGVVSTGYEGGYGLFQSASNAFAVSDGFFGGQINGSSGTLMCFGRLVLMDATNNVWGYFATAYSPGSNAFVLSSAIALAGPLSQLSFFESGGGTFDAGSLNVAWGL